MALLFLFLFLICFIKAYVVGTRLNSMQFKWVPTICAHIKLDKKYTGCNLKTLELLNCALTGVCVVIRSNKVIKYCCKMFW